MGRALGDRVNDSRSKKMKSNKHSQEPKEQDLVIKSLLIHPLSTVVPIHNAINAKANVLVVKLHACQPFPQSNPSKGKLQRE